MDYNSYLLAEKEYPLAPLQRQAQRLKEAGKDIINLTIGDPKEKTYSPMKNLICEEVKKMTYSQYPNPAGELSYLKAVSKWAKQTYNIDYSPQKNIISCNGSKEAIFSMPLLFNWSKGKEIFIPSLSYPVYANAAGLMNIPIRYLNVTESSGFLPDLNQISPEEWKKCGLFWINSPHNPTTAIASKDYFTQLLDLADHYGFLVCSDECYNDLYYENTPPASCLSFTDHQNWIVFRSLSKRSHMTGFRIGALLSKNELLIATLKKMRSAMGVGTPTFIQKASILAWEDMTHARNNAEQYRSKRNLIKPILESKGFNVFGGNAGFYFWFSHPDHASSASICQWFLDHNMLIVPGTVFGTDGEGYARMIYCETDKIMETVSNRIKQM